MYHDFNDVVKECSDDLEDLLIDDAITVEEFIQGRKDLQKLDTS